VALVTPVRSTSDCLIARENSLSSGSAPSARMITLTCAAVTEGSTPIQDNGARREVYLQPVPDLPNLWFGLVRV
jgi:hypothetical protein